MKSPYVSLRLLPPAIYIYKLCRNALVLPPLADFIASKSSHATGLNLSGLQFLHPELLIELIVRGLGIVNILNVKPPEAALEPGEKY